MPLASIRRVFQRPSLLSRTHSYHTALDVLLRLRAPIDRCCVCPLPRLSFAQPVTLSLALSLSMHAQRGYARAPLTCTVASRARPCLSPWRGTLLGKKTEAAIRRHDNPSLPLRAQQYVPFPVLTCCSRPPVPGILQFPLAFPRNFTCFDSRFSVFIFRASFSSKFSTFRIALFCFHFPHVFSLLFESLFTFYLITFFTSLFTFHIYLYQPFHLAHQPIF